MLTGVKDAHPIPLTGFLLEWFGVGTWQSLNVSDDLKYDVGKRFLLGHLLAVCPQANPCTSLGPRFAICQWYDWTRGSFLALLGSSSVKSTLV